MACAKTMEETSLIAKQKRKIAVYYFCIFDNSVFDGAKYN